MRSTFLLRRHDSSAPGLRVLRPLPSPVCRAWRWGCLEPHVGEPHVGGGGGQRSLGRLGFAPPWGAVERQMWAGARPALAGMERVIPPIAFFLELF